jgi:hypothetical protein
MNWKGCERKRTWLISRHYPDISSEGLMKSTKHISQYSRCPGRDSNPASTEYRSEELASGQLAGSVNTYNGRLQQCNIGVRPDTEAIPLCFPRFHYVKLRTVHARCLSNHLSSFTIKSVLSLSRRVGFLKNSTEVMKTACAL